MAAKDRGSRHETQGCSRLHSAAHSCEARAVNAGGSVRIVIELDRSASTVSGRLAVEEEPPKSFFGWLELIDSLERLQERPTSEHKTHGDRTGARR